MAPHWPLLQVLEQHCVLVLQALPLGVQTIPLLLELVLPLLLEVVVPLLLDVLPLLLEVVVPLLVPVVPEVLLDELELCVPPTPPSSGSSAWLSPVLLQPLPSASAAAITGARNKRGRGDDVRMETPRPGGVGGAPSSPDGWGKRGSGDRLA